MGRYGYRTELDGLLWIDTKTLKKFGYLDNIYTGGTLRWSNLYSKSSVDISVRMQDMQGVMHVNYTVTDRFAGSKSDYSYDIRIVSTDCNYGGYRYWFLCPLVIKDTRCNRRIRKLYCHQNYFGCRTCLRLCYSSQNESLRHRSFPYKLLTIDAKIAEIEASIKRRRYAKKPTKQQIQLDKLYSIISVGYNNVDIEDLL